MATLPPRPAKPAPLIIDTDPGIDDLLAIILALAHPDYARIEAITLNFGNTTLDHERSNVLRLFDILHKHVAEKPQEPSRKALYEAYLKDGCKPITLSSGAAGPLGGQRFSASYFHGRDGISGVSFDPANPFPVPRDVPTPLKETKEHACDVILDILRKNPPGTVRIAAVGPVTNLALAWRKDPETFLRVGGISVMGGALDVPGNFNTYADPFAAQVLTSEARLHPALKATGLDRLPIDLLPLDITSQHLVPFSRLCGDDSGEKGILRRFSPRKVTNSFQPPGQPFDAVRDDQFTAHDPLAVAHALFAPTIISDDARRRAEPDNVIGAGGWSTMTRHFNVETKGEFTRGLYVIDRRRHGGAKPGHNRVEREETESTSSKPNQQDAVKSATAQSQGVKEPQPPADGLCDVVTASPGVKWFEEIFCQALGV